MKIMGANPFVSGVPLLATSFPSTTLTTIGMPCALACRRRQYERRQYIRSKAIWTWFRLGSVHSGLAKSYEGIDPLVDLSGGNRVDMAVGVQIVRHQSVPIRLDVAFDRPAH